MGKEQNALIEISTTLSAAEVCSAMPYDFEPDSWEVDGVSYDRFNADLGDRFVLKVVDQPLHSGLWYLGLDSRLDATFELLFPWDADFYAKWETVGRNIINAAPGHGSAFVFESVGLIWSPSAIYAAPHDQQKPDFDKARAPWPASTPVIDADSSDGSTMPWFRRDPDYQSDLIDQEDFVETGRRLSGTPWKPGSRLLEALDTWKRVPDWLPREDPHNNFDRWTSDRTDLHFYLEKARQAGENNFADELEKQINSVDTKFIALTGFDPQRGESPDQHGRQSADYWWRTRSRIL